MSYQTTRTTAIKLTLLCMLVMPFLITMQLLQALLGSPDRAFDMAFNFDRAGNSMTGGKRNQTISERVGNNLLMHKAWAVPASKVIDFFFGKNHCLDNASIITMDTSNSDGSSRHV